jgi:Cd2+/Zn2+-exporting ATPase
MAKFFGWFDKIFLGILLISILVFVSPVEFFTPSLSFNILLFINSLGIIPIFFEGLEDLKKRKISVAHLAVLALILSLIEKEFLSTTFINMMLVAARLIHTYTDNQTQRTINHLLELKPKQTKVYRDSKVVTIETLQVKVGDTVIVNVGDRISVDGKISKGFASLDQSSLTGESIPVDHKVGDEVCSSSVVVSGNLEIIAEKVGKDSTLEKIIMLVQDSEKNKADISTLGDIFAQWYIIIMLVASVLIFVFTRNTDLVLSFILITCADDIAVAVPLAYMGGMLSASRFGLIIKGAKYLEGLSKVDTVLFDKTGTITNAALKVDRIVWLEEADNAHISDKIKSIASISKHPVSNAIYTHLASSKDIPIKKYEELKGLGVEAFIDNKEYFLGKLQLIQEKGKTDEELITKVKEYENKGFNVSIFATKTKTLAIILLNDTLKKNSALAIQELQKTGLKHLVILSGDNEVVTKKVADAVGIKEFFGNLMPSQKIQKLKEYAKKNQSVAMIGDGINDAAVLKGADIGIAMGAIGSDITIEAADIVIMDDNLMKVADGLKLSKFIYNIALTNFVIWGIINIVGLYLIFEGFLNPSGAAFYNFVTDLIPIAVTMRAFFWKPSRL